MYEGPIQDLIDELARLPGIGPKSAQRLAFYLVKAPDEDARRLADVVVAAKERITFCRECGNVAEGELCRVCRDPGRDATVLCVVEEPKDAATIEHDQAQWKPFCQALEAEEWIDAPRYRTMALRVQNRAEMNDLVSFRFTAAKPPLSSEIGRAHV